MQETRRAVLDAVADGPVSGPQLADSLGCSRTAVWKHVEALRESGFGIESGDDGYVLASVPEFGGPALEYELDTPFAVEYHEQIASTNARAKEIAEAGAAESAATTHEAGSGDAEGVVVLADEQTGGRGRLDREWASPSGGIWCSLLVHPDRPPADAPLFTLAAAVAVVEALESVGVDAGIKWPNDVLVSVDDQEQKLAGVLTEMAGEHDRIDWLIVGIGLNANIDPRVLPDGATSLRALVGDVTRRQLTVRMLETLQEYLANPSTVLDAWRGHALTLGRRVRVETGRETMVGTAVEVSPPGSLVIETGDGRRTVTAGDCTHLRPVDD